jgi:hypothetical protein
MSQQQIEYLLEQIDEIFHIFMRDVYYDLHPTTEQQNDENWWNNIFMQKAVNSDEYNFQETWEELRDTSPYEVFLIIEMINQINKWSEDELGHKWDFGVLTHSKIYKMYAYMYAMRRGVEHWKNASGLWNHDMDEMSSEEDSDIESIESIEEEYTGTKDFPPNETDDNCPICLDAYTSQKQRDGIRCSDIPSNCSHYCCESCWYVIWGQHNDTNNCPICKRDITMWLSTHYPNQAITDFLKTLPPPK